MKCSTAEVLHCRHELNHPLQPQESHKQYAQYNSPLLLPGLGNFVLGLLLGHPYQGLRPTGRLKGTAS